MNILFPERVIIKANKETAAITKQNNANTHHNLSFFLESKDTIPSENRKSRLMRGGIEYEVIDMFIIISNY
jgi:hypothetical protein